MQQQQAQQQGLVQALDRLATIPSGDSGRGSGTVTNPARGNPTLVDTKGLGKPPPLKNTDSEFVSWARRTDFRRERTSWSERCLDVGRGKRVGNGAKRSDCSLDTSGHSANAGRSAVHSADDLFPDDEKAEDSSERSSLLECPKLGELQRTVERLEDLMRRYTQRRDARNGHRHTLAEDIRMAALEALLPERT